jgi:hypothetical protein
MFDCQFLTLKLRRKTVFDPAKQREKMIRMSFDPDDPEDVARFQELENMDPQEFELVDSLLDAAIEGSSDKN